MTKANVGLGILQIPFVFMTIGLIPGIILLIAMAILIMWTATYIQGFKMNHPEVYGYADIGQVIFGRVGREVFSVIFVINFIFVTASAIVAVSTSLNAVSMHGTCTAVFIAVSAIVGWMLASIKTLGDITWLGWVGMVSILASVLTLTVAVGINDRPAAAPQTGPWDKNFLLFGSADAVGGISAITNVLYAYAATPTYWGIISEMRDPRMHNRMMFLSVSLCCMLYIVIGSVVYYFCGQYVSSPALGSAGVLLKRVW
jgi:amino acid permease